MDNGLPFFNWSLKEVLVRVPDSFTKARIKIITTIISLAYVKILVVITEALLNHQSFQFARALVIFVVYTVLLKWLFYKPSNVTKVAHFLIIAGNLIIWSNLVLNSQQINIVMLQFVFMVSLSSFYLTNKKFGVIYSAIAIIPVVIIIALQGALDTRVSIYNEELGSPGVEILIILNFLTIVYSHYLFYQAIQLNIEEKIELNNKLRMAVEEANKLAMAKSDFLSVMSHELRTPLNSVIGSTNMLMDNDPKDSQKEELRILKFSTNNLLNIINDILDFNKTELDKMELETIPVRLGDTMHDICAGLRFAATEKSLELILDVEDQLVNVVVLSDPTRITQVIYNLVWNAIKFTEKGSVEVTLKQIANDEHKILVRFSVSDTGIGIDADRQQAIFEPFTQAYSDTARHFGGTGLGLAIVKRLLSLFKSSIHLKSIPNKGSDFFFDIDFETAVIPAEVTPAPSLEYDLLGMKVLIAEDNEMSVLMMKKLLSKWNVETCYVENGSALIALMDKDFSCDVILMDLNMPIMGGLEATLAIRSMTNSNHSSIPIIALTASVSEEIKVKILDAGMNDYLYKPFEPAVLYLKLKQIKRLKANTAY